MSKNFYYFPILKTTESELKAYQFLDNSLKESILPIFELTKSRKTKKNPESKLEKKLEKLYEVVEKRHFILDLTTETTYSNKEIEKMLYDGSDGYREWVDFLKRMHERFNIIPTINYHPEKSDEVRGQIESLMKTFPYLAIRAEVFEESTVSYIKDILSLKPLQLQKEKIILILDGKFISINNDNKKKLFEKNIRDIYEKIHNASIVCAICAFSSFPKSVIDYGKDSCGEFNIIEAEVNQKIISSVGGQAQIYHGDYASIHPVRYDTGGGGWVPRIDVPLIDKYFYYRYRRNEGSYTRCAEEVIEDDKYEKIKGVDAWGDNEIKYASQDQPRGRSPSHWIAVRSNLYMTRQYLRLKETKRYLSLSL